MADLRKGLANQAKISVPFVFRGKQHTVEFGEEATILELVKHIEKTFDVTPDDQSFLMKGLGRLRAPFEREGPIILRDYIKTKITVLGLPRSELADLREAEDLYNEGIIGPADEDPFDWDAYRIQAGTSNDTEFDEDEEMGEGDGEAVLPPEWRNDLSATEQEQMRLVRSLHNLPNPYLVDRRALQEEIEQPSIPLLGCPHFDQYENSTMTVACACIDLFISRWFDWIESLLARMQFKYSGKSDRLARKATELPEMQDSCASSLVEILIQPDRSEEIAKMDNLTFAITIKLIQLITEKKRGIGRSPCDWLYLELTSIFNTLGITAATFDKLPDQIHDNIQSLVLAVEILERDGFLGIPPDEPQAGSATG